MLLMDLDVSWHCLHFVLSCFRQGSGLMTVDYMHVLYSGAQHCSRLQQ